MLIDDIVFYKTTDDLDNKGKVNLYDCYEGFMKGNMFSSLYKGMEGYTPVLLQASSDKDQLVLKIYMVDFALNDLSLYLDIYPDNKEVYSKFREYTENMRELVSLYEKKYGPLELGDAIYSSYMWYKSPWPFEGGEL